MAYLSEDKITGTVLVNLHSDGLAIYNNTSIERNIEKSQIYFVDRPVSTDITKFSKGSILNEFNVPIGEDISGDFTFSVWGYVTNGYEFEFKIGSYAPGSSHVSENEWYMFGFVYVPNDQTSINCQLGSSVISVWKNSTYSKSVINAWHHYAVCCSNNMLYWFVDGELANSLDISDSKYQNFVTNHGIFKMYTETDNCRDWNSSSNSTVYMDDMVVIKDQCLWSSEFDPPTEKLIGYDLPYTQTLYSSVNEKDKIKIYY